jgi:hypothetical protein
MFIAILTLLSALSISGVAIFYSVIGLATIFPGAFVPVVIMGSVLEVGKLIAASWLYRNWKYTRFILKTYLTVAVVVLSIITSMGIFGFLSKAHLEQNLASENITQRIELINSKITSQQTYILRQNAVIERAEKSLTRTTGSNTEAIELEKQNLKDVQDKFKTLLVVETNTIKNLNDRLKILDKDVSDVLTAEKSFFNEEKAAADLKASQKEEREAIQTNTSEAQGRIAVLKDDYANDTTAIQTRIDKLREGSVDDKSGVNAQIIVAEDNIINSQNTIDDLIIERGPLESSMLKLEAEVGPVKYIAALVVDWGVTDKVELNEAVRWVILLIIVVFDPLAVALLLAANQSLLRRFPTEAPKPQEVINLEKPDEEDVTLKWNEMMDKANANEDDSTLKWNEMMDKANAAAKMEKATSQLKDWKDKLEKFNTKVPKPNAEAPVDIIQEDDSIPHIDLKSQKKTNEEEIVADNKTDSFDLDEVAYDIETPASSEQLEKEPKVATVEEALKMPESESVDTPIQDPTISEQIEKVMEPERTRPDFTEVIKPEIEEKFKKDTVGMIGQVGVNPKGKVVTPVKIGIMSDTERKDTLDKFHKKHGNYKDISDVELKVERDLSNKAKFLEEIGITEQEAQKHGPITESRMAFFQDHIDDILRGDTTAETLPDDLKKTLAVLLSDFENPDIITKGSALKNTAVQQTGLTTLTPEELKEKFMIQPKIEDRPITDDELDELLAGFDDDKTPSGKTRVVIKDGKRIFIPVEEKEEYIQNEEQNDETMWNKGKVLDIPEPEKNEIQLPELKNTTTEEGLIDAVDSIKIEQTINQDKFTKYKKRVTSDEDYRQRIEDRINDFITKLENKEIKIEDLTKDDQKVIIDILNQNG